MTQTSTPVTPPKAVLFDVGNVVVHWSPRSLYSKLIADPVALDRFLAEICPMSWHVEADRGKPFAQNIAERIELFPEHEALIRAWWERWDEMSEGAIPQTVAVMTELRAKGVPMPGLTNMSREAWPRIKALTSALDWLDPVVVSAEEGVIKPDPAIYRIVCERTGFAPADMVFVDDSLPNIEAAAALGFHVHHFTDPAALRPQLESLGLL